MKREELFISFDLTNDNDIERIKEIGGALNSIEKLKILKLISKRPMNLSELSSVLKIPVSTVFYDVNQLTKAGLVKLTYQPGLKGKTKVCSKAILGLNINFADIEDSNLYNNTERKSFEMPVGAFTESQVNAPCGMASTESLIENCWDNPIGFYSEERLKAELLWFDSGFISYSFPSVSNAKDYKNISVSFEVCSETAYFHNDWPSDITIWINDVEIATYTSPGDFGGRRGNLTPEFWQTNMTQFGLKKTFTINEKGVLIDGILKNKNVSISDLGITSNKPIILKIGIKENAIHKGGINLFGKHFGDYPQAIVLELY